MIKPKLKILSKNTPFKSQSLIRKIQDNRTQKKWLKGKIYLPLTTYHSKLKGKGFNLPLTFTDLNSPPAIAVNCNNRKI